MKITTSVPAYYEIRETYDLYIDIEQWKQKLGATVELHREIISMFPDKEEVTVLVFSSDVYRDPTPFLGGTLGAVWLFDNFSEHATREVWHWGIAAHGWLTTAFEDRESPESVVTLLKQHARWTRFNKLNLLELLG